MRPYNVAELLTGSRPSENVPQFGSLPEEEEEEEEEEYHSLLGNRQEPQSKGANCTNTSSTSTSNTLLVALNIAHGPGEPTRTGFEAEEPCAYFGAFFATFISSLCVSSSVPLLLHQIILLFFGRRGRRNKKPITCYKQQQPRYPILSYFPALLRHLTVSVLFTAAQENDKSDPRKIKRLSSTIPIATSTILTTTVNNLDNNITSNDYPTTTTTTTTENTNALPFPRVIYKSCLHLLQSLRVRITKVVTMWFSSTPETKKAVVSMPTIIMTDQATMEAANVAAITASPTSMKGKSPTSADSSAANSAESLPNITSLKENKNNGNGQSQGTSLKRSASASGVTSRSSSTTRRRVRVQFDPKERKFPTKQFTPEKALLLRPSAKKGKSKKGLEFSDLTLDVTADVLNDNNLLRDRIDQLLASGYTRDAVFSFAKGSSGYTLQSTATSSPVKRNSTLTPEPCPSEVAKFSMAFDPYKVVTIIFPAPIVSSFLHSPHSKPRSSSRASSRSNSASTLPHAQAMLAISSPSGPDRAQSFVFEGVTYTWQYYSPNNKEATDEATSSVEKSLCSLYLTKKVNTLSASSPNMMTDLVCARFLRKSEWKKKGASGAIIVDEAKADVRVVLVSLMVVLRREARGKLAKVVGMGRWR